MKREFWKGGIYVLQNQALRREGKPVSVCGELGGDPLASVVLIGLGIRKLSMNISSVAREKKLISSITLERAQKIAEAVQHLATSDEVQHYTRT